jgi:putative sigma-54 modulation protein
VKIQVQARHMEMTDALRQHVEGKVEKLPALLHTLQSVEVIMDREAESFVVEVVASARKKSTFVATHRDADMYSCVDQCLHKVAEQIRRHKDKVRDHQAPPHGQGAAGPA